MANPTVNAGADSLPSDEPRYRLQAHRALQQDVYESLMANLDEGTPAAELVEGLSGEIELSDFKLLLSSPRLMDMFRDVMTARGVSVRSGRGVRIREALAEVLYEREVLDQIKAHVVDRMQSGLAAPAADPHTNPGGGRDGDRHSDGNDLTSLEREAEAKRPQQVSQRFLEEVKYTRAPDADLGNVLEKVKDCITDLSLSHACSMCPCFLSFSYYVPSLIRLG
jgi:hypothetical protein